MSASSNLFRRRFSHRFKIIRTLVGLVIDFWVALYFIIPGIIFIILTYSDWLKALPGWFLPAYLQGLLAILTIAIVWGTPRTYLTKADIVILYSYKSVFKNTFNYGIITSIILNSALTVLVLIVLYPFYHHLMGVNLILWIWVSIWVLIVKISVLLINWRLFINLSTWPLRATKIFLTIMFVASWTKGVSPFISHQGVLHSAVLILSALAWMVIAAMLTKLLTVRNWDIVVANEEYSDFIMMKMFLGPVARAGRQGTESGPVGLSRGRLGMGFKKERALTYLFLKYFMRNKNMRKAYGNILSFGILIVAIPGPFLFKGICMIGLIIAAGFWLQLVWQQESNDLFVRMLPIEWRNSKQGIAITYRLLLLPITLAFFLVPVLGYSTWAEGSAGLIVLLVVSIVVSIYFGLSNSFFFNFDQEPRSNRVELLPQ